MDSFLRKKNLELLQRHLAESDPTVASYQGDRRC